MPLVESPYSAMHKLAKNEPLSDIEVNSSSLMVSRIVVLLQRHYESTLGSVAIVQHIVG